MFSRTFYALSLLVLLPSGLAAQAMNPMLAVHGADQWYALIEVPALVAALVFSFLTARALRGGRLGNGMMLIALGFLVMAVGHLHMQLQEIFDFNLFGLLFGATGGAIAWVIALLVTWVLTGLGFFRLYRASSGV